MTSDELARVHAMAAALRRQHPLVAALGLRLDDVAVVVRSNDGALLDDLRAYFGPSFVDDAVIGDAAAIEIVALDGQAPALDGLELTVRPPEPGKSSIKEAYVDLEDGRIIRKLKTGVVFLVGGGLHLAIGACRRWQNQIINFINNRFIEARMRDGWILCHAAAVARGDRGLVLAGFSGMGKSTLALHMMEHGLDYVSNDRLLIRAPASGRAGALDACGVPKLPRINPGTALSLDRLRSIVPAARRAEYDAMETGELWAIEEKYDVDVDAAYGAGRIRLTTPVQTLMILNWERGVGACEIRRVDLRARPELLAVVMKTAGLFYEEEEGAPPAEPVAERYLELFADVGVFELAGGVDFAAAVEFGRARLGDPAAQGGASAS